MLRKIKSGEVFRIGNKPTAIQNLSTEDTCKIDTSLRLTEGGNLDNPDVLVSDLFPYQTYIIANFPSGLYLQCEQDVLVSD